MLGANMKITPSLYYANQSVNAVQGNNRCMFWDPHKTHKYSVCGQNVELLDVKHGGTYSYHWGLKGPATGHFDTGFSWFPCVYV